jgi:hypothetical protein
MPTITLDNAAFQRAWDGLGLMDEADAYKSRAFKRARELLADSGQVDPIGPTSIRKALRDAVNEILRDAYPAPPPHAATGRSIDAEFSCQGDPIDMESATLHASALRWIELGGDDPNDADVYAEAVEAMAAYRR